MPTYTVCLGLFVCFCFHFYCLGKPKKIFVLCWIKLLRVGIPCLVPDFSRKAFSFSLWNTIPAVGLSWMVFMMLRYVSSVSNLVRVFIMYRGWILSNAFSASIEMIVWFLTFLLLVWCMKLIDWFAYIEPSWWTWGESHLVLVYELFMCCWIQ